MALNWNWSEKCGEATLECKINGVEKEYTLDLYQGNAYLIFISNYEEDGQAMYNVWSFWVDKDHAKNCLGIGKNKEFTTNMYEEGWRRITKFRFDKDKTRHFADIISLIAKTFNNISIEIYSEQEGEM